MLFEIAPQFPRARGGGIPPQREHDEAQAARLDRKGAEAGGCAAAVEARQGDARRLARYSPLRSGRKAVCRAWNKLVDEKGRLTALAVNDEFVTAL